MDEEWASVHYRLVKDRRGPLYGYAVSQLGPPSPQAQQHCAGIPLLYTRLGRLDGG